MKWRSNVACWTHARISTEFRSEPDKIERAGLDIDRFPRTGQPFVRGSAVAMACRFVTNLGRNELGLDVTPSHQVVLGRIDECLVDETWLARDEVLLEEVPVILYMNRVYTRLGEKIGVQRFTDDAGKRVAKMREYRSVQVVTGESDSGET